VLPRDSPTNLTLTEMDRGSNFDEAVKKSQELDIAGTDHSFAINGRDATVKVCALDNVLMDYPLSPTTCSARASAASARRPSAARA
jgi:homoserine dehydrogenase